ncbi:MFS transporter [Skeletonema marinoi]|uniref:MFS transporter n=1 Tax=Skeletonema marinoi TaxID=267567 RepID=A0AAD8Y8A0_9STRA|nr:MFS transporter [Skeletonema marinoi]
MPPIPPRTQDVIAGGGSFSACLERAIRRPPSPPILGEGGSLPNINEVAEETTPPPTEEGGDTININVDELLGQDWSSHHASYHLLQECLAFFSRRRLAVKSAMRDNNNDTTTNTQQNSNNNSKTLSEHELTTLIHTYAKKAPNLNDPNVMEYASQRALGTTPPRGYNRKTYNSKRSNIFTRSLRCGSCFTEEEFMRDEENSFASGSGSSHYVEMMDNTTANPLSAPTSTGGAMLTEAEVIKHLSFIERVELSAVLDSEVERAAMFYRHRLAELAPNREDGEVLPKKFKPSGDHHGGGNNNSGGGVGKHHNTPEFNELLASESDQDDDLIESSSNRVIDTLSFNDLGSEILELHAFITTNIIVVRQILIRYDAFVRSLGGSPMSSWYQKSRRLRKNGRSSDFRDLTFHSKLKRLTLAYIGEYKQNLEDYENDEDGEGFLGVRGSSGGGRNRRRRRFRGFANQFHKLVDAAEEIKKRQRAKWRQPAMNVSAMDFGEGFSSLHDCGGGGGEEGGVEKTAVAPPPAAPMERVQTPPLRPGASSDSYLETPLSERTGAEVVPPLQPPDYASLRSNPDIGEDIEYQVYIFKCVQSKTQRSIEKTYTGRASGVRDNFITTLREYFLLGSAMDNLSLMPEYLIMRGKSLKSSLLVVAQWRDARKANLYGIKREPEGVNESWFGGFRGLEAQCLEPQPPSSSSNTSFSLVLNILSCFLYMMNYYIVGPSSVEYANALGAKDAMSGLIIGAMPWAALISAVLFSIWSNKSYRSPLLASGVLLIAGNILYSSAYRQQSIVMALCGRFLTGLGGPRSMNRRYIADTTPLAYRTAANAAFGTATALGAAVGPAIAVLLDTFDFEVNLPLYGSFYFNGMTGPGYLMSVLWAIYLILTICMFREPVRSGLIEQVEKEREIERSNSYIQSLPAIQTYPSEYEMSPLERRDSTVTNYERGDSVLTNFERDDSVRNYDRLTPFQRDDSVRSNYERGDSAVTNFDRDDSIRYYRSSSSRTNEVNDCAACPVDNRVGFGSDKEQSTPNKDGSYWSQIRFVARHMTPAVHLCMFLIFSKQFTVENLISGASMVTKNRYGWELKQVGALGTVVGCLTIPISVFVGWISQYSEDGVLMLWLITCATVGMALLVDPTDFVSADTDTYNEGNIFAVGPGRYYAGYLLVFCSVQAFDGVVGSVLSKVIPTALAAGTLNSGLLATIVGTLGRALGDAFITAVGYINLRQVQNLLFVPSFVILVADLILVFMKRETLTA